MTGIGQPIEKPKQPRVALWVTDKELSMIADKFVGFRGSLADAIHEASVEARKARTQHNRQMRHYRHARRQGEGNE